MVLGKQICPIFPCGAKGLFSEQSVLFREGQFFAPMSKKKVVTSICGRNLLENVFWSLEFASWSNSTLHGVRGSFLRCCNTQSYLHLILQKSWIPGSFQTVSFTIVENLSNILEHTPNPSPTLSQEIHFHCKIWMPHTHTWSKGTMLEVSSKQ